MEPKKNLKKHTLVEPKWAWTITNDELVSRINEISNQIHLNTLTGSANWVITGSDTADLLNIALEDYGDIEYRTVSDIDFNITSGATTMDYIDGDWGDGP